MDLRDLGWGGVVWIDLDQETDHWGALVNTVMKILVS
jgi:hypothetical protein